jgi:hypothetical protein
MLVPRGLQASVDCVPTRPLPRRPLRRPAGIERPPLFPRRVQDGLFGHDRGVQARIVSDNSSPPLPVKLPGGTHEPPGSSCFDGACPAPRSCRTLPAHPLASSVLVPSPWSVSRPLLLLQPPLASASERRRRRAAPATSLVLLPPPARERATPVNTAQPIGDKGR